MRIRLLWVLVGITALIGCQAPSEQPISPGGGGGAPGAPVSSLSPISASPLSASPTASPTVPPAGFPVLLPPISTAAPLARPAPA